MAAATSSGWATAVSRISSASAVVPDVIRSHPGQLGPGAEAVGETGQFQPRGEEAGRLSTLAGRGDDEHFLPCTVEVRYMVPKSTKFAPETL